MNVLITGVAGFIGHHLAQAFAGCFLNCIYSKGRNI